MILTRTPYSVRPYGPGQYPASVGNQRSRYFREGYIIAYQDVRGRYMSEGDFINVRPYNPNKKNRNDIDESSDAYDTIDWLVKNIPNNSGRVGVSGISYPGFYTSMATIDAHPAVKATSPQAPVSKWFGGDDFYHNGAFLLPHAFDFYSAFGKPRPEPKSTPDARFNHGTPDGYQFFLDLGPLPNANAKYLRDSVAFWHELMNNGVWNEYWDARDILTKFREIKPAVITVGGWFDEENLFGALHTYHAIEKNTKGFNSLVMGPWYHGQWSDETGDSLGYIQWGSSTSLWYADSVEVPFFRYHLKGEGTLNLAEASMFETGGNRWHKLDRWPPRQTVPTSLYLGDRGGLSFSAPEVGQPIFDEYQSNPWKPVPYTAEIRHWYNPSFPVEDQRFASRRPDVLVYQTEILDRDVTVAGPLTPTLFVSTSGTDCDWIVKVIDVFPDSMTSPQHFPGT
ncbi:MAG: CocE/NonD family hydrolase, partial [Bacteroidota bacterium]